jgi:hypothetical protein
MLKKEVPSAMLEGTLWKISHKYHILGKKYEIMKSFGGFPQIFSFLLLKLSYLAIRFPNM